MALSISNKFSPLMLFFRNSFSYCPQLTLLSHSDTRSSSQFFAESGLSISEKSDSVGLAKDVPVAIIAGIILDGIVAVCADEAERFEVEEASGAEKGVLEDSIAIVSIVTGAWRLGFRCGRVYLKRSDRDGMKAETGDVLESGALIIFKFSRLWGMELTARINQDRRCWFCFS